MIESILKLSFAVITLIASYQLTKSHSPKEHWRDKVTLSWSVAVAAAVVMLGRLPIFDDQLRFFLLITFAIILIVPDLLTGYLPIKINLAGWAVTALYLWREPGANLIEWSYSAGMYALMLGLPTILVMVRHYWSHRRLMLPVGIGDFILIPLLAALAGEWVLVPLAVVIATIVTLIIHILPSQFLFLGYVDEGQSEENEIYLKVKSAQPAGPGLIIGAIAVNFIPTQHLLHYILN